MSFETDSQTFQTLKPRRGAPIMERCQRRHRNLLVERT